jgi:hypothetical protein
LTSTECSALDIVAVCSLLMCFVAGPKCRIRRVATRE